MRYLPFVLVVALVSFGCGEEATESAAVAPGEESAAAGDAALAEVASPPAAELEILALPEDQPQDIPAYPGTNAEIKPLGNAMSIAASSTDAPQVVFDFYKGALQSLGWAIKTERQTEPVGGTNKSLVATKEGRTLLVFLKSRDDGNTEIGLLVSPAS